MQNIICRLSSFMLLTYTGEQKDVEEDEYTQMSNAVSHTVCGTLYHSQNEVHCVTLMQTTTKRI